MKTQNSVVETIGFDLSKHAVSPEYFRDQVGIYETKYRLQFSEGWGQFFAEYVRGNVDKNNLDFEEWAFLCEHFMKELTESQPPPGPYSDVQEKPETLSGFSFGEKGYCLTPTIITAALRRRSTSAHWSRSSTALN